MYVPVYLDHRSDLWTCRSEQHQVPTRTGKFRQARDEIRNLPTLR